MTTHWIKLATLPATDQHRIDGYLSWARISNPEDQEELLKKQGIPLLFQLNISAKRFASGQWGTDHNQGGATDGWQDWLRIPALYASPAAGLEETTFCTANVTDEFFTQLRENSVLRAAIRRYQYGLPVPLNAISSKTPSAAKPVKSGKPKHVVTGVIDDALAFSNERFRRADGSSRIEFLWDQDGPMATASTVAYGREILGSEITASMKKNNYAGLVDEDAVYRELHTEDYSVSDHKALGRRRAHGTHVMDLACGLDPAIAKKHLLPIIGVQLPGRTVRDTSGAFLWPQVCDALRYILDRADAIAYHAGSGPLPVVVNLSYGTIAGPHDGSSILETGIDEIIQQRALKFPLAPLQIVMPSGNNYQYRCHAQFKLQTGEERELTWRILPDDRTPSFLQIWMPNADLQGGRQVKLWVTTPTGDTSPAMIEGDHYKWQPGTKPLCEVIYTKYPAEGDRPMIQLSMAPTATLDPADELAPCGNWQVKIENISPEALIDAWIQRDDTPFGWPVLGRQSRFEDVDYVLFDASGREEDDDDPASYTRRAGSINALATGGAPVVVAGCLRSDLSAAEYSSAGPIVSRAFPIVTATGTVLPPRARLDPDAMAVSDDSMACHGVLAAGTRSGSVFALNGTSVAAPQVARWIWGQMRQNLPSDGAAVEGLALWEEANRAALPHSPYKPQPPAKREGAGRIDDQLPAKRAERWTQWPPV